MAINVKIFNGKTAPIETNPKNGFVYRDELNETRDSATVVIRTKNAHLDIEPFDYVEFDGTTRDNDIKKKSLLVDSFTEEQTAFGDVTGYDTTINLFSQMKELERVTCPNLSISALADGTRRSVWEYIQRYLDAYAPKIKVAVEDSDPLEFQYENAWYVSQDTIDRFSAIDCPEFSWNSPTLCEVITDLMMVDDCIPSIKENCLSHIDLKARGAEIDHAKIVSAKRQMSSQDYNQSLVMNMKNAIGNRPSRMVEYISFRNETDGLLTTANLQIVTQKPIYGITKVVCMFRDKYYNPDTSRNEYRLTHIDLTQSIKEKNAYDVLDPSTMSVDSQGFLEIIPTHKIANVYYKRRGRTIEGWSVDWDFGFGTHRTSIEYLLDQWLKQQYGHYFDNHTMDDLDVRDLMFVVEYETLGEATMNVGRNLPLRNPSNAVFDNQGSSYVDINQQSIFEYAKANRLANRIIEINGIYDDDDDVPELGQTYDGAVIFSREIQYYDDSILFHAYATENYVLANYFVAVRAKRRSWAIASGNEALTRHDNVKYYAEFSFDKKEDAIPAAELAFPLGSPSDTLFSSLRHWYNDESIKLCAFTSASSDQHYPGSNGYFILDCSVEVAGMSMAFVTQFSDNYSVGVQMKISGDRRLNQLLPYADNYGEFSGFTALYLSYCDPADGDFVWPECYVDSSGSLHSGGYVPFMNETIWDSMVAKGRKKPVATGIGDSVYEFRLSKSIAKDNREVFALTSQIEFCSDDPHIIVNRRFVQMQKYVTGANESAAGLPMIAGYVRTEANLPTADAKYKDVGFLIYSSNPAQIAFSVLSDGSYRWSLSDVSSSQKFAVLEGYAESTGSTDAGMAGYARRVRIARFNRMSASFIYFEYSYKLYFVSRKLTESDDSASDFSGYVIASQTSTGLTFSQGATWAKITISGTLYDNYSTYAKSWALTDADGNVLVSVNVDEENHEGRSSYQLYINILKTRDYRICESQEQRQDIVGYLAN